MSFNLQEWLDKLASLKQNLPLQIEDSDFNVLVMVKYHQWVIDQVESLFKRNAPSLDEIKAFFLTHWNLVKFSQLSPTAIPESDVVLFLCQLAESLATADCKPLEIMMPGVMWLSLREPYPNLDETLSLADIFKTHLLSDDGKTLIPIALLNEEDILNHAFQDHQATIYNPYYEQADYQYQKISDFEFKRLCGHSSQTDSLTQAINDFANLLKDKTDLHSHLLALCHQLKFNDAHAGIGREEKVGEGVFVGLVAFGHYFEQLSALEKQKIPEGLLEAISHLLSASSEPMVQTLSLLSASEFRTLTELVESKFYKGASSQNYNSIRFTGAEIRELEKALGRHELAHKLKPVNMVNLIYTCAGIRREEIEKQMIGHETLLMSIGLEGLAISQQKQLIFEKIHTLSKSLKDDLQANRYRGVDKKSLTIQLLKQLNIKSCLEIRTPQQLQLIGHMQADEIDLVLLELPYLKRHILNQFSENWSWISLFYDLSVSQLDVVLKHISDLMRWRSSQFYEALFSLQPEKRQIILKHFMHLFVYDEFKRIQPLELSEIVTAVLELPAQYIIKFLRINPVIDLIPEEVYLADLIEKIKLEPRILLKDDFYHILGNVKICQALLTVIEPELLSELVGRYVDLGMHVKKQCFVMLVEYLLNQQEKKYLLNLVSYINYEELQVLMKAYKKEFIPQFLDGISKIRCPDAFVSMVRVMHHLKPAEIQRYHLHQVVTGMAESIDLERLVNMESNDFFMLFIKSPTVPAISLLFSRVDGQKKLSSLFKHVISLHYVYNNFDTMNEHQAQIISCLIQNLVSHLHNLSSLERKDIFMHRMTYRLLQKFDPNALKNIFQYLSLDELKQVFRKESNGFWKEISLQFLDYLSHIDDELLVEVLGLNSSNGSRLIDILPQDLLQEQIVPRIQKNPEIILNHWWILERSGIATQLPYLMDKKHLYTLMERLFFHRNAYPNLMLGIIHSLSLLGLDDDALLLKLLLMKNAYNTYTWGQYFFENPKIFDIPLDLLKFRLKLICNPRLFAELIKLNDLIPELNDFETLVKLAKLGGSGIYDGFECVDFQNLIDSCVREPSLSPQLPLMMPRHLKVFSSFQFQIHLDSKKTFPLASQDKLFSQVADYLIEQFFGLDCDSAKVDFLQDKFFDSNFALWVKIHKPFKIKQMLETLNFEKLLMVLKIIKHKFYFCDFLPYLWQFFPDETVIGLEELDGTSSILQMIDKDFNGCLTVLSEKYTTDQKKILKLIANHIEDKDFAMNLGAYFQARHHVFFAHLLKDIKFHRHFLKFLEVLLKHNTLEHLMNYDLIKDAIIERFMLISLEHSGLFKGFFHFQKTDSVFDFNRWMSVLPDGKRLEFVSNLPLLPQNFLLGNAILQSEQSSLEINYLIYTAQCNFELVPLIIKKFLLPPVGSQTLLKNFLLRENILELFGLEPASIPIILNYMLNFYQPEFNHLIQHKWLKNELFILNLVKYYPDCMEKIINLAPYEHLKILKETSKGFVLFCRVEHVLHQHQILLAFLFNQLSNYDARIDYFQRLKNYRTYLEQQQPLLASLSKNFTKFIFEGILKKQFSECVGSMISKVHYHHFCLRDKLIGFGGDKQVCDNIDDILADINIELLSVSRNLNLLRFKKSLTFFNSVQHEKLEVQTMFLETKNLLLSYQDYLQRFSSHEPATEHRCNVL